MINDGSTDNTVLQAKENGADHIVSFGFIADLLSVNRKLLEKQLIELKKIRLNIPD